MGQYYVVANVDKAECFVPIGGMKISEFAYKDDVYVQLLTHLLGKRWKGDRVYIVGDCVDGEKYEEVEENWLATYRKLVLSERNLYVETDNYKELHDEYVTSKYSPKKHMYYQYRYLVNPNKKLYVDMENLPKSSCGSQVSPLVLLLTMGNGRMSGDFHEEELHGYEHVGAWVEDSQDLRIVKKVPAGYVEFRPDFISRK